MTVYGTHTPATSIQLPIPIRCPYPITVTHHYNNMVIIMTCTRYLILYRTHTLVSRPLFFSFSILKNRTHACETTSYHSIHLVPPLPHEGLTTPLVGSPTSLAGTHTYYICPIKLLSDRGGGGGGGEGAQARTLTAAVLTCILFLSAAEDMAYVRRESLSSAGLLRTLYAE